MSGIPAEQRKQDMMNAAPWIREALKERNDRMKAAEAKLQTMINGTRELRTRYDAESAMLKGKLAKAAEIIRKLQSDLQAASQQQHQVADSWAALAPPQDVSSSNAEKPYFNSMQDEDIIALDSLKSSLTPSQLTPVWTHFFSTQDIPKVAIALVGAVGITNSQKVVEPLTLLAASCGSMLPLILGCITAEVESCDKVTTLFRGNSLASKLLKEMTKLVVFPFIQSCLMESIQRVISENRDLEVDPNKSPSAETHVPLLIDECEKFLDSIVNSLDSAPLEVRTVCRHISEVVGRKFGSELRVVGVGAFAFLRLLGPVFMSPQTYGIHSGKVPPGAQRTLILVSKVIQNLANQVEFGRKEPYMEPLNSVVRSQQERVNTFLMELALVPKDLQFSLMDEDETKINNALKEIQSLCKQHKKALLSVPVIANAKHDTTVGVPETAVLIKTLKDMGKPQFEGTYAESDPQVAAFVATLRRRGFALAVAASRIGRDAPNRRELASSLIEVLDNGLPGTTLAFFGELLTDAQELDPEHTGCQLLAAWVFQHFRSFLKDMLGSIVHNVVQGNIRCEVVKERLRATDNVEQNSDALIESAKDIVESVLRHLLKAPHALWQVFTSIPDSHRDLAPLFLAESVVLPALAHPIEHWLTTRTPQAEGKRTLALLADILRGIFAPSSKIAMAAELTSNPRINTFVKNNADSVQTFIRGWMALFPQGDEDKYRVTNYSSVPWPTSLSLFKLHEALITNQKRMGTLLKGKFYQKRVSYTVKDLL